MIKKDIILSTIIFVLSATFLIAIIYNLQLKNYYGLFWMCWTAIFIIILGIRIKSPYLILSQIIILAVPDILWTFDALTSIFMEKSLLGIIDPFIDRPLFGKILFLQHSYTVPLSLIALSRIKIKKDKRILLISFVEILIFFFLTLILIPPTESVNCVHKTCANIFPNPLTHKIIWFSFMFASITLAYLVITSLNFLKDKKK